ncbi:MAG: hypothetical protein ACYCZN_07600 [Candidatus Dormibacteria bacterium]
MELGDLHLGALGGAGPLVPIAAACLVAALVVEAARAALPVLAVQLPLGAAQGPPGGDDAWGQERVKNAGVAHHVGCARPHVDAHPLCPHRMADWRRTVQDELGAKCGTSPDDGAHDAAGEELAPGDQRLQAGHLLPLSKSLRRCEWDLELPPAQRLETPRSVADGLQRSVPILGLE